MNDAGNVAVKFYNWLIEMGYMNKDDIKEDITDLIIDFNCIEDSAPRLFNLLKCISDH